MSRPASIPVFSTLTARAVPLPAADIDTDQIIPARYLKVTGKDGLGRFLFADRRRGPDGAPALDVPVDAPERAGAQILVAGANFGCGSSREHAAWALLDAGFRAVVAPSFADIFAANALGNGVLPVVLAGDVHARLMARVVVDPGATLTIDLEARTLTLPDGDSVGFPVDPFARRCLLEGIDRLGYLLRQADRVAAYEAARRD